MSKIEINLTLSGLLKAYLIKFSGLITSPFNHKGFYNLCKIFSLIPSKEDTIILRLYKDCVYEMIFKDPYWN